MLAASLRYGTLRRQTLFLVLAAVDGRGLDEVARRLGSFGFGGDPAVVGAATVVGRAIIALRRPRDLVNALLGQVPSGLLGALRRFGDDPLDEPRLYLELVRLCGSEDPADRCRVRCLGQISGDLNGSQVEVISLLDPLLLHPAIVARIYKRAQVAEIEHALTYIRQRCARASDAAIRVSLGRLTPNGHRSDLIKHWAERFDRAPVNPDFNSDPTLVVLDSAAALTEAGRRFKNCLSGKVPEVILGVCAFVEYKPERSDEPSLIIEMRYTTGGYLLEGIYAANNRRVHPARVRTLREKLAGHGILLRAHAPGDPRGVRATANLLNEADLVEPDSVSGWGVEAIDIEGDLEKLLVEAA